MSYSNQCAINCPRTGHFSNPDIYLAGVPTGDVADKDNARTGDNTAPIVAAFRPTAGSEPPYSNDPTETWVAAGLDDGGEISGVVDLHWLNLRLNYENPVGVRFSGVNIPWGSTIESANLEFTARIAGSTSGSVTIEAEASDDAPPFIQATTNLSTRTRTTASVPWVFPAWDSNTKYQSPDISNIVQELVDQVGWNEGASQAFLLSWGASGTGVRDAYAAEGGLSAPLLYVDYRTCNETITLPQDQWVMFSLPCTPLNNTVADLFSGLSGANYDVTWVVFEKDAVNDTYVQKALTDELEGKVGYWFYSTGATYDLVVDGMENRTGVIDLEADAANGRFNLVGYPGRSVGAWADVSIIDGAETKTLSQVDPDLGGGNLACDQDPVDASCIMSRKMYQWNGSAFQTYDGVTPGSEGSFNVFDSLWVKVFKSGISLSVPDVPVPAADMGANADEQEELFVEDVKKSKKKRNREYKKYKKNKLRDWYVRLTVESGNLSDPGNVLGQLSDSVDGFDSHDLEELKPFGNSYLTVVFPHDEWEKDAWGYTSDFHATTRKPKGKWRFQVKASADVQNATLRWSGPDHILRKARIIDEASGKRFKLKQDGSYQFNIDEGVHSFRFVVK
ncbi:hypothetical protein [Solemya velum gill symbiont]|uniref:hypothetical protein n=1 Tax=Solemya velum gill symbiont TaxID=2340 RepID=UPI000996EDB1|nr:hypothetical protein [Solemya velum gill symbiont]OOZ44761.1 hypothetical protein BOW37_05630 [Solemya velum gill symbiont]OOZ46887.1 hypothetical protein BOW38_05850 [Solemya velum gill symbiont]OOZ50590.1 hypothetical protein BOW39_02215 [Solemya velum gill symbiont]OOZ51835.1 hypothetical protein BOW40_05690 [Solemya velum gill symbiont]OOZ54377.1 hypothetical protein BOW41_06395 [Solemya velum gill symbiont]